MYGRRGGKSADNYRYYNPCNLGQPGSCSSCDFYPWLQRCEFTKDEFIWVEASSAQAIGLRTRRKKKQKHSKLQISFYSLHILFEVPSPPFFFLVFGSCMLLGSVLSFTDCQGSVLITSVEDVKCQSIRYPLSLTPVSLRVPPRDICLSCLVRMYLGIVVFV